MQIGTYRFVRYMFQIMATEKQIAANRRNAKMSTGPKTTSGKATSSRNALKHGVLSESMTSEREGREKFQALLDRLIEDHEPETALESLLVERLANLFWRERRLARAEKLSLDRLDADILGDMSSLLSRSGEPREKFMTFSQQLLIGRYQTMLTNQISQTLRELRSEKEHRLATIEAEPGQRED